MLLDRLKSEQRACGMTDVEFATFLGVPRSTWTNAKLGFKRVGPRLARAAKQKFPDLTAEVDIFLLSGDTSVTGSVIRRVKEPSNIDIQATEARHTLVLLSDRETVACSGERRGSVSVDADVTDGAC